MRARYMYAKYMKLFDPPDIYQCIHDICMHNRSSLTPPLTHTHTPTLTLNNSLY